MLLLATYLTSVPEGFHGQSEFHAAVKGPLKNKSQLEAHLTIPKLNASYQSLQIEAAGPIRADYATRSLPWNHPRFAAQAPRFACKEIFPRGHGHAEFVRAGFRRPSSVAHLCA